MCSPPPSCPMATVTIGQYFPTLSFKWCVTSSHSELTQELKSILFGFHLLEGGGLGEIRVS